MRKIRSKSIGKFCMGVIAISAFGMINPTYTYAESNVNEQSGMYNDATDNTLEQLEKKVEEKLSKKDYKSAIEYCQNIIQVNPNNAFAWALMGRVYNDQKEYDKTIESCQKAIQIDPLCAIAWNSMGYAYNAKKITKKLLIVGIKQLVLTQNV